MSTAPSPADDLELRLAHPEDAAVIAAFNREMAAETESRQLDPEVVLAGVKRVLVEPARGFYVVVADGDDLAGCLMVTFEWSDWRDGDFYWIQSVYVRPSHRRRGVYRRLHEYVRERARAAGNVCGIRLYVEKENARAQATYHSVGMADAGYLIYEEAVERGTPS